ncbi:MULTISPECIES: MarR family winged helix-turn-helix transcriptional regulator [Bizionia]|uniref:MarR family transcriptional regulator n=1 Tax=Bizionia algoritergicola TaxID=291187 RepID=A0A5D0QYB8_9FLAO|nr:MULTISPECIES: MarR family transcriptional regulator [Bizionia]TYB73478.1 MarR family transcriptional regulator [Bizionia algoritergicola]
MGNIADDVNSRFDNNKVKVLINILFTAGWITNKQNAFFKPFGISPQQYNILRILKGAGEPLKAQTVKDRMIERAPNATRLMDKLSAKQLIERVPCDHDRRVVYIHITKDGLALIKEISADLNMDFLENLSENEAGQLSDLLDKLR